MGPPTPPMALKSDMHFMPVRSSDNFNLSIRIDGTINSSVMTNEEYGVSSFFFTPNDDEIENLKKLENLIDDNDIIDGFTKKATLNADKQLSLKVKVNPKTRKLKFKAPFSTMVGAETEIQRDTPCTVTVAPGFYFSDNEKMNYGLYYTLKELSFPTTQEVPEPKAVKKAGKKSSK